jgi:hypothetical protein
LGRFIKNTQVAQICGLFISTGKVKH